MIWTADEGGRIDYVNERFSQYFRLNGREVNLSNILSRIHPDERQAFTTTWTTHIGSGKNLHIDVRLAYEPEQYKWHMVKAIAYAYGE